MCVCALWIMNALHFFFFLLRDVFERLICWLDLCLNSLLVAFISMCFSTIWKTPFLQARHLLNRSSTDSYLSSPLDFLSRQKLVQFWSIELSGICLNSFSTASRSIEKLFVWLINSQQLINPSWYFCRRQILDNTLTDSFLLRFSAR